MQHEPQKMRFRFVLIVEHTTLRWEFFQYFDLISIVGTLIFLNFRLYFNQFFDWSFKIMYQFIIQFYRKLKNKVTTKSTKGC